VIHEYLIGPGALWERLGLGLRTVVGLHTSHSFIARADQVRLSEDGPIRLTCPVQDLQRL
jgi:hypothetical protein